MKMKIKKRLKVKGYIYLLRRSILLLSMEKFDFTDYGFYIFLVTHASWDKKKSTFGCINMIDAELAMSAYCDPSTIHRRRNRLKWLDLIEEYEGMIKIKNFDKFTSKTAFRLAKLDAADLQEDDAQTQVILAELQDQNAYLQENRQEEHSPFEVPFKENLGLKDEDIDIDKIADEIDKMDTIKKEYGEH